MMIEKLQQAVEFGLLRALDVQFARLFAGENEPRILLALSWLSYEAGVGHICLPLSQMSRSSLFNGSHPELAEAIWQLAGQPEIDDWYQALWQCPAVSDGRQATPIILFSQRLYLQRLWLDEGRVAQFFAYPVPLLTDQASSIRLCLAQFFPMLPDQLQPIDWQKVAAAVAVSRQVAIISGGPGTGKTTTVARLLATLIKQSSPLKLRIVLAAPTGKAAARLTQSLNQASDSLPLTAQERVLLPEQAFTLHRLLGAQAYRQQMRYHRDNPLHLDVLVLDEASMVDLPMMARLIEALPVSARVILLGDRDQLASVEAGAVLGDLCQFVEQGYSPVRAEELSLLTGLPIPSTIVDDALVVRDSLCLLRHSYRFATHSGIGQLALAINQGNTQRVQRVLQQGFSDISWSALHNTDDYDRLLELCVQEYGVYLDRITDSSADEVLRCFNQFQVLCAIKNGPYGVTGINQQIEQALIAAGKLPKKRHWHEEWYVGRPVMLTQNSYSLELYNGDVGITLLDNSGQMRVYFQLANGQLKSVQPNRLPQYETAYAMTVHKSQGSEFDHTLLVLPDRYLPLITRELLYTAVTRARNQLTLFAEQAVLFSAVLKRTERRSGLAERLRLLQPVN